MTLFQMNVTTEIALTGAAILGLGAYMFTSQGEEKAVEAEEKAGEAEEKAVEAVEAEEAEEKEVRPPRMPQAAFWGRGGYIRPKATIRDRLIGILERSSDYPTIIRFQEGRDDAWDGEQYLDSIIGIPLQKMWELYPETKTMYGKGGYPAKYYGGIWSYITPKGGQTQVHWGDFRLVAAVARNPKSKAGTTQYSSGWTDYRKENPHLTHMETALKRLFDFLIGFAEVFQEQVKRHTTGKGTKQVHSGYPTAIVDENLAKIYALMSHTMRIEAYRVERFKQWHHYSVPRRSFKPKPFVSTFVVGTGTRPSRKESTRVNNSAQAWLTTELGRLAALNDVRVNEYLEAVADQEAPTEVRRRRVQAIEDPTDPTLPIFAPPILVEPFNPPAPRL